MMPSTLFLDRPNHVILVGGPTASGKSQWVLNTILSTGCPENHCIINADSMQLYRGLELLTASPSPQEKSCVPHALYGIIDAYSPTIGVAEWRQWVHDAVNTAHLKKQRVWIVGGTGFYLRTLYRGLSPVPALDPSAVAYWRSCYADTPLSELRSQLADIDTVCAQRLVDQQRIIHALIVHKLTGHALSWWQQYPPEPSPYTWTKVLHWPEASTLKNKAITRWKKMAEQGVIQDVENFCTNPAWEKAALANALGVRCIHQHIQHRLSFAECEQRYLQETRQYIKRQKTWFRWQFQPDVVIESANCPLPSHSNP